MSDWYAAGRTAVITGAASGIGLAAAQRFHADGLNVVLADRSEESLAQAKQGFDDHTRVLTNACDVTQAEQLAALADAAFERFGAVHCLMNNAGVVQPAGAPWEGLDALKAVLDVNLWGVARGCSVFIPRMLESNEPGVVINTGSKQGITKPPGNYAYNLSKAAVLTYTESLAHSFVTRKDCKLSAHLLVPGFVYTGMIQKFLPQKPASAWTPEETVDFMLPCLKRGDFYILCPDNETTRAMDKKRIQWTADDLIKNRPALSRWHPEHKADFEAYMAND